MNELAYCKKHKFNVFVPSCLPRKLHNAPSCKNCKGLEKPIYDCLCDTNKMRKEKVSHYSIEKPNFCTIFNCEEKHYQREMCREHFNIWWVKKGTCLHFNKALSRAACYQRQKDIAKGSGSEKNKYCLICKGIEWMEIKS